MSEPFRRGETLLIRDLTALEIASASFEFLDEGGNATLIMAARTDVTNLERIEARFGGIVSGKDGELLLCSFCGKSQVAVFKLIAGPGVYVCNECIDICNEIIADDGKPTPTAEPQEPAKKAKKKAKGTTGRMK